jgi:NADPH-dependent curcumin reductase CurA
MTRNRQIVLSERPTDRLEASHFSLVDSTVGSPSTGELLVRTILLSIDPANRAWMQARTYRDQLQAGDVMDGFTLAQVVAQNGTDIPVGAIVECEHGGWQEYAVLPATDTRIVEVLAPLPRHMGVLGITGLSAYFGLLRVGRPQVGETVVVSAAAGATGHVVGQLARVHGARVVGISSSDEKNRVLQNELGFDATVNHRSETLGDDLRAACPRGVDVYFDNVGGPLLERLLRLMNIGGRIVCCGVVSQYDTSSPAPGPRGVPGFLVSKRLRMQGFLLPDYRDHWPQATRELAKHLDAGEVKPLENVIEGLENAPEALIGLLAGHNLGKTLVRVAPDPNNADGKQLK